MRRRRQGKETLEQIAQSYNTVHSTVSRLTGPMGRRRGTSTSTLRLQERILRLAQKNKTDAEIAKSLGYTVGYISRLRADAGMIYAVSGGRPKEWTRRAIIERVRLWRLLYGYTPSAVDWNPSLAKNQGQSKRADRYYAFREKYGCPSVGTVYRVFGSWSEMLRVARLKPPPQGGAGHGRWQ